MIVSMRDHASTTWRDTIKSQQIMGGVEAKSVNSKKTTSTYSTGCTNMMCLIGKAFYLMKCKFFYKVAPPRRIPIFNKKKHFVNLLKIRFTIRYKVMYWEFCILLLYFTVSEKLKKKFFFFFCNKSMS